MSTEMNQALMESFEAAPDFAKREAFVLNVAVDAAAVDRVVTGELLVDYVDGSLSWEEVIEELRSVARGE